MLQEKTVQKKPDDFRKSIGISIALHSVILSLFLIRNLFFSEPMIDLSQAISVSVGDMKDIAKLPEKVQAPPPAEEPEPIPEEEPVEEVKTPEPEKPVAEKPKEPVKEKPKNEEVNLTKAKAKQKDALNKLKKLSAVEKIKQDLKKDSIARVKASNTPVKPRVIAAGTELVGLDKLQANDYLGEIDQSIKQFWTLPQWLMNKPLKAQVLVKFNTQGQILSTKLISSSGNSTYDQYCLQAIEKAAPFPKVPDKLSEKFSIDGIVIGFPE